MNEEIKRRLKNTFIWTASTISVSLIFTFLMAEFEKGHNPELRTWGDVVWWWVVTVTGLGLRDILPITVMGKIFGSIVLFSNLILFAIVVSEFSSLAILLYEHKDRGIIKIKHTGHIVIFGYTSLTAGVIQMLKRHYGNRAKLVLISNDVDTNPFPGQVAFLSGNPISSTTLKEANITKASAAIILANDRFNDPDSYSLVIASGIDHYNSNVAYIAEIINDEKKELFKEMSIDGFIHRDELLKDLLSGNEESKLIRIINKQTDLDERENLV